jgi:thioredoxin reductase (NADPH)
MSENDNKIYDVIIVGAGAAGLTAAIYASRRMLKTLVIARSIGGQAATTSDIENYPGFERVDGLELMNNFKKQAELYGATFVNGFVTEIKKEQDNFIIDQGNETYRSRTVILGFGLAEKEIGVPGEKELKGRGVSYCATCDAPLYKNKTVAVVGGGNAALDAAELLSKIAAKVYFIHRRDKFTGEQVLIDRVMQAKNIEIIWNSQVSEVKGDKKIDSIIYGSFPVGENKKELKIDGLFVEIGNYAKTEWLKYLLNTNEKGEIIITQNCETNVPGIFAAGDITTTTFKQIVISAGEGAKAALQAYRYLQNTNLDLKEAGDWNSKK